MDAVAVSKRLLGMIEKSGIDGGEVYVQQTLGLEIVLRDQAVERLRNMETGGFALRLIDGNRMGFVHSSDLRDASLEHAVEKAVGLAKIAEPSEFTCLAATLEAVEDVETCDRNADSVPYESKVGFLKDVEAFSFAYDPAIKKIEFLSYEDSRVETIVANTYGLFRHAEATRFSVNVSVVAERDGDIETGGEEAESRFFEDLDPPSKIASRAGWKATSLLGGKTISTRTAPVIFERDTGRAFLAHMFAMVNGTNVADGISALGGRIGQTIASPLVSIIDDATLRRGIGSRGFDDEGTPSRRTVVVDRGTLRSFLFDERSGRKAGFASTANANRDGFRQQPSVGYTNLFVDRGSTPPDEILKSTDGGLWLVSLAGWWVGISPATGDFSSGAKGLWIEDGQVAHAVKNVTVASNIFDMLAGVDAVGDDLYMNHESTTPTLRVGEMRLGGV